MFAFREVAKALDFSLCVWGHLDIGKGATQIARPIPSECSELFPCGQDAGKGNGGHCSNPTLSGVGWAWCCSGFDGETNTGASCGISRVFDLKGDFRVCWKQYSITFNGAVGFGNGGLTEYLRTDIPGGGKLVIAVVGVRSRPSEGLKVTFLDCVSVGGDARFGLGVEGGDTLSGRAMSRNDAGEL